MVKHCYLNLDTAESSEESAPEGKVLFNSIIDHFCLHACLLLPVNTLFR